MNAFIAEAWGALGGDPEALRSLHVVGEGSLPSAFDVTGLAVAAIGAAGLAAAEYVAAGGAPRPSVQVDRRLASMWFSMSLRPIGWQLPPAWDAVAGDYRGGWQNPEARMKRLRSRR